VTWDVDFEDAFEAEFLAFSQEVQDALLAAGKLLADYGPLLGRPYADTLKGSKHANMKELRFTADGGEWRVAFAFDPRRKAILLVAGDKAGRGQTRFYNWLIATADQRFSAHLAVVKPTRKRGG
jgi:hypothetical protein